MAGTNPNNKTDRFRVANVRENAQGDLVLSWNGIAGRTYDIEYCDPPAVPSGPIRFVPLPGMDPVEVATTGLVEIPLSINPSVSVRLLRVSARMTGS